MRCRKNGRRNGKQSGAALVELALILPLLLLMTFITTEFGRALYQYNIITKSVRDAVRYLSAQPPGTGLDQARNLVVYGNTAGTGTPLAIGLPLANVAQPAWQFAGTKPQINTVTITVSVYCFQPLLGSAFGFLFANQCGIAFSGGGAAGRAPAGAGGN